MAQAVAEILASGITQIITAMIMIVMGAACCGTAAVLERADRKLMRELAPTPERLADGTA